jgi:HAMP domain-containing protein
LKLLFKFNLVFILLFLLGIAASGYISWELLQKNAREEVAENARLMMSVALAVRSYSRISSLADRISLGELEAPDIQVRGRDEIRTLAESLARLRKSLAQAMQLLEM